MLADTNNFYVIPDQFGVVSGHVLVLPKARATSIAALDERFDTELRWLLQRLEFVITATYAGRLVVAEHGECGSTSMPQAHIHVLPIPRTIGPDDLRTTIDRVLHRRRIGAGHDLHRIAEAGVVQQHVLAGDVVYPAVVRALRVAGSPYVYFLGPGVAFLAKRDLGAQFAREVAALANGRARENWDRHVNKSRKHMFTTFRTLASTIARSAESAYGFTARAGM